jgi:DNA (cytosine-5)-methyltransferase 1
MRYLSLCSGIEAATVAWEPLGWQPAAYSEIEPFCCSLLNHYYPDVPNVGDMTCYKDWANEYKGAVDLIVGGTPCQSFSVAGLRKGLDDPRGNLALVFLAIVDAIRPQWLVWENVPGVLSSNHGRDFGALIGALGQFGYGWSYRVLNAQYFGVPQRRRRVFVVGHLGDWRPCAAVLFERESLSRHTPPSRKAGQEVAGTLTEGFGSRGIDADQIANGNSETIVTTAFMHKAGGNTGFGIQEDLSPTIISAVQPAVAYNIHTNDGGSVRRKDRPNGGFYVNETDTSLRTGMAVRRLTPRECERLQGFPDDYTLIPYRGKLAADGPRYKALGNSMAVPVMRWIGDRIAMVEAFIEAQEAA